jgi:hypothetical protein
MSCMMFMGFSELLDAGGESASQSRAMALA